MLYSKLLSKLFKIHKQKKILKRALVANDALMSPGWYGFNGNIAFRIKSGQLDSLRKSKGYKIDPKHNIAIKKLIQMMYLVIPPFLTCVSKKGHGTGTQLLITASRSVKIFDCSSQAVQTVFFNESDSQALLKNKEKLSAIVPVVDVRPNRLGDGLIEPLLSGVAFCDLAVASQLRVLNSVIEKYERFAKSNFPSFKSRQFFRGLFKEILELPLPPVLENELLERKNSLIPRLTKCPFYPCHGDLHGKNIIVEMDGITIIDLETVCHRPIFYDLVSLLLHEEDGIQGKLVSDQLAIRYQHLTNKIYELDRNLGQDEMILIYIIFKILRNPSRQFRKMTQNEDLYNIAKPYIKRMNEPRL
ncbi:MULTISPECIES: phosphotransferase family protein [unclassified Wenzhouxiangella]|uniref:phosphotransferase family protein n=1 Tax=unclassified Wenzhouxiangella TaxID=2613841 RepID=UPI000E325493|nr:MULTISPECIES: phosphotransferase [unclassified Wenzhouxiangella]RFF27869.1 hypothetical protein DZK25_05675 [Wenzhouxiangella sp. 15181]RFP69004.1 hypothetical protein DZK26_05790 [Wenzhouxiangella sp. 15190]